MNKKRWLTIVMAFLVLGILAVRPVFGEESPELQKIKTFVFTTLNEAERLAEVKEILNANPQLANAMTEDDIPILMWTVDNLGAGGELARKSLMLAEMLVEKGADVNGVDKDGNPMLIRFGMFAQVPQIRFMTGHGVKVDARDKEDGRTALHWVALLNEWEDGEPKPKEQVDRIIEAADILLAAKADVNARDNHGQTPLHSTAFLGNLRLVEFLLSKGADIDAKDNDGYTPLGLVKMRLAETWANDKEKKPLPAVIEFLEKRGDRDERPKE